MVPAGGVVTLAGPLGNFSKMWPPWDCCPACVANWPVDHIYLLTEVKEKVNLADFTKVKVILLVTACVNRLQ